MSNSGDAGTLQISPDGKLLAYFGSAASMTGPMVLTVVPFGGGSPVDRLDVPPGADEIRWAPDG